MKVKNKTNDSNKDDEIKLGLVGRKGGDWRTLSSIEFMKIHREYQIPIVANL